MCSIAVFFLSPQSSIAAFLGDVGLAFPSTPRVGLLRPVVTDPEWHLRLRGYMQQAIVRDPVAFRASASEDVLTLEVTAERHGWIQSGRRRWEGRPMIADNNRGRGPSLEAKLATVGRQVNVQSIPRAGREWYAVSVCRVAEVRRYLCAQEMVSDLAGDLCPARVEGSRRLQVFIALYGEEACVLGFVAMRLEVRI